MLAQPAIKSVFPSAAQQGTTVAVEFRGTNLEGAYALWTDSPGVKGEVNKVTAPAGDANPKPIPSNEPLIVELRVEESAQLGNHLIRLVSPSGLSNAVSFFVTDQPVQLEVHETHHTPREAQTTEVPALIHGRLDKSGQLDCFSLLAAVGDELAFEVIQTQQLSPRLSLLGPSSSWFDSKRLQRQLFLEQQQSDLVKTDATGTFIVLREGRYVLQVSSLFGQASEHASYLLAISRGNKILKRDSAPTQEWKERSFTRELGKGWLDSVLARSSKSRQLGTLTHVVEPVSTTTSNAGSATILTTYPGDNNSESKSDVAIALPTILEGTIDRPSDMDRYRFTVQAGDEIAIEIETPLTQLPSFNPWIAILNSEEQEVFSNMHRKVSLFNNNAERHVYIADVMPKIVHHFDKAGEYTMQVQDVTTQYGAPTYKYRIFVRPQVPHVGEISLGGWNF